MSVNLKNVIFHSDKITKISEKLNQISVGIENDKYARVELVDQRLSSLEDQISQFSDQLNKKFALLKENVKIYLIKIGKINKNLEDENNNNGLIFENKMKEIANLEMRVS